MVAELTFFDHSNHQPFGSDILIIRPYRVKIEAARIVAAPRMLNARFSPDAKASSIKAAH